VWLVVVVAEGVRFEVDARGCDGFVVGSTDERDIDLRFGLCRAC
jgi:hypothetical protein